MKKMKLLFSLFVCLTLTPYFSHANSAASGSQTAQISGIATAGAAGSYAAANQARCGRWNFSACVQAVMGVLQMIQSLMGAANAGQSGADWVNGDYGTFDPVQAGFCFDPSTGCTPDAIDNQLKDFDQAFKTGTGYDEALEKLKAQAEERLKSIENMGYKVDTKKGIITGPNGQATTFAAAAAKVPKNLGAKAKDRFAKAIEQLESKNKTRGLASAGGAGGSGGVVFKDEYYDGDSKFGKRPDNNKAGKKKKNSLLASLTDKDAKKGGIGVAGDNIFGMVNRRYIKKTKSSEFLKK